jgi:hypothetical protein
MNQIKNASKVFLILSLLIISCDKDKEEQVEIDYLKFKLIAWNSLSPSTQKIVLHDWKEAEAIITKNPDYNENVIVVIFHTPYDFLTCPISVYVDIETEEVIHPKNIPLCD